LVLLVLTLPVGPSHGFLALHQEREALVLRKQRLALEPILLVFLSDRRIAEDLGLGEAFDESANWIVHVPPGHDHQEACAIAEPSEEIVREPVPNLVANRLAHRLRSALDWIVDDADVQTLAGDLALTVVLRNEPRWFTYSNMLAFRRQRDPLSPRRCPKMST